MFITPTPVRGPLDGDVDDVADLKIANGNVGVADKGGQNGNLLWGTGITNIRTQVS